MLLDHLLLIPHDLILDGSDSFILFLIHEQEAERIQSGISWSWCHLQCKKLCLQSSQVYKIIYKEIMYLKHKQHPVREFVRWYATQRFKLLWPIWNLDHNSSQNSLDMDCIRFAMTRVQSGSNSNTVAQEVTQLLGSTLMFKMYGQGRVFPGSRSNNFVG
jgi:hypothetical protein